MNKEEILAKSRKENKDKPDERELIVVGKSARIGMMVGAFLCVALVLVSEFVLNNPILGITGWLIYFAMLGSTNLVNYIYLKKKMRLAYAIVELLFAVVFAVVLFIKG